MDRHLEPMIVAEARQPTLSERLSVERIIMLTDDILKQSQTANYHFSLFNSSGFHRMRHQLHVRCLPGSVRLYVQTSQHTLHRCNAGAD